jgi:hypothetical protein
LLADDRRLHLPDSPLIQINASARKWQRLILIWTLGMHLLRLLIIAAAVMTASLAAAADDQPLLQEEVWALPLPQPTIAYVVRPVGDGPFPLAIMNHGVSLDPAQRVFFPLIEFRDAAMWFARRGYMVVAPSGSYGAAAIEATGAGCSAARSFPRSVNAPIPISVTPVSRSRSSTSGSSNI